MPIQDPDPFINCDLMDEYEEQLLQRRIADTNTTEIIQPTNTVPDSNVSALTSGIQNIMLGAVSPPSSINNAMLCTQTPPANIYQVVEQVQEEEARQQQSHVIYGRPNPGVGVPGQNMPPTQVQQIGHLATGEGGNLLPMHQCQQHYPGGADQGLMQAGLQQPAAQLAAGPMQDNTPTVMPGAPAIANPGNTIKHKEALYQLLKNLKSPQSPDQQREILQLLKSNPQLMAAFIKRRQVVRAQQGEGAEEAGISRQQFQHMLSQQQTPAAAAQHQNQWDSAKDSHLEHQTKQ